MKQLVEEDPERPPVNGAAMAFALDDLRRQILVRADEGHGSDVSRFGHEFRESAADEETKVGFRLAILLGRENAREEIRRLHTAVDGELVIENAAAATAIGAAVAGVGGAVDVDGGGFDESGADGAAEREIEIGEHDVTFISD